MDITLLRTFLSVASSGSFGAAAERMYITQSAISLRIKRLEDSVGQSLFHRSKGGAELTSAGQQFEPYALRMIRVWEESRQQIALPDGYDQYLNIGAHYALWPRLGYRWIDALRRDVPGLSIRGEVGMPERLMRLLLEGTVHAALMYTPQMRPGLTVRPVMEDSLVLVAGWADPTLEQVRAKYVYVDWGEEFAQAHSLQLPELTSLGLTLAVGSMAGEFVLVRGLAAYLPARFAARYIEEETLHLVPDAPVFPFPIWSVWRDDMDPDLSAQAFQCLDNVAKALGQSQSDVLEELAELSDSEVDVPGDPLPGEP
jgi:DNA-binding transcriptional LysR family regulator